MANSKLAFALVIDADSIFYSLSKAQVIDVHCSKQHISMTLFDVIKIIEIRALLSDHRFPNTRRQMITIVRPAITSNASCKLPERTETNTEYAPNLTNVRASATIRMNVQNMVFLLPVIE